MKILTYAVFGLVALTLAVACALWGGFAASVLWGWFVVPLGVPEVSVLHAMGLTLALRALAMMASDTMSDLTTTDFTVTPLALAALADRKSVV